MAAGKQFIFDNHTANLTPFTKEILAYVAAQLPTANEKLLFRAKFVITELLTNALKHSGMGQSWLNITVDGKLLYITKKDLGAPLPLVAGIEHLPGDRSPISCDAMHILYAVHGQGQEVHFICEEGNCNELDIHEIIEHFGLIIITKSSDRFTYRYLNGENLFTVLMS
jgi:hypothetical protein